MFEVFVSMNDNVLNDKYNITLHMLNTVILSSNIKNKNLPRKELGHVPHTFYDKSRPFALPDVLGLVRD